MNQSQLRCFIEAVRSNSLSQAARELYLSQPAVSYQISTLEDELGSALILRSNSGIALTEAGKKFLPKAHTILNLMEGAAFELQVDQSEKQQTVSLVHFQFIHDPLFQQAINAFYKKYPHVTVNVTFGTILDELENVDADVYIECEKSDERFYPPNTQRALLWNAYAYGIVSKEMPLADKTSLTMEEVRPYPLLFPTKKVMDRLSHWYWWQATAHPGEYIVETSDLKTLQEFQFVLLNYGGVFFSHGIHTSLADSLVQIPFTDGEALPNMIIWKTGEGKEATKLLVDFLLDYYQEHSGASGEHKG